jgi:hypothetical protein
MSKFLTFAVLAFTLLFSAPSYSRPPAMMLGGDVGLAFPTGDFGDAAKTGFGLNGAFTYFLQPDLALTGILGYWSFGANISGGGYEISWSIMPLNAGIQYRFQASGWHPYIGAETFLFFSSASVKYLGYSSSSSDTDFGFTPLVGGAFKIAPNLEFRATAKYVIIFTSGSSTTYFSLLGGIHFILP